MNSPRRKSFIAVAPSVDAHRNGPRYRINAAYVDAVENAGLIPIVIPPMSDRSKSVDLLNQVGGLLLTGGDDIDPSHYGEERHPATEESSSDRDQWELELTHQAKELALPTLAICRGMQLVNVAFGGSLIQDIASQRPQSLKHDHEERTGRKHPVSVAEGSLLAALLETEELSVNSMHHQALGRVASQMNIVATAPDGIIEAVEWADPSWWMVAVQWHPEELINAAEPWDRNLFRAFAQKVTR